MGFKISNVIREQNTCWFEVGSQKTEAKSSKIFSFTKLLTSGTRLRVLYQFDYKMPYWMRDYFSFYRGEKF